jgi:transcriptional regulator with XRE-family HTH domain
MNIGISIKNIRESSDMTQTELSELSGLSQTSISLIENGVKEPRKATIEKRTLTTTT